MKTRQNTILSFLILITLASVPGLYADHDYDDPEPDYQQMVVEVFNDVMDRHPTRREIRTYSELAEQRNYDYRDLEREIRDEYDTGSHWKKRDSRRHGDDREVFKTRRWVESAFEDAVGRLPDEYEMREYCDLCMDEDMSKRELERAIREDYEGVWEPYYSDRDYHYDFPRYTDDREAEMIIEEAYQDYIGRAPDRDGLRNYRTLMIDKGWSEKRIRENIANSYEALYERNSKIVTRAYEDLLDRTPSDSERDHYVDAMYKHKWDERKMRDAIRESQEFQYTRPRRMIEEAYREVLLREADSRAYEGLRKEIVKHGWTLEKVKDHLRKSAEYRNVTIPKMVKQAYQEILGRDPDPQGERNYISCLRNGWTYEKLKKELRKSEEYRSKH